MNEKLTCLLDPTPTILFKEVFPLINIHILDLLNLSLKKKYGPQDSKVVIIKSLLKKPDLDPEALDCYISVSTIPLIYFLKQLLLINCVNIWTK